MRSLTTILLSSLTVGTAWGWVKLLLDSGADVEKLDTVRMHHAMYLRRLTDVCGVSMQWGNKALSPQLYSRWLEGHTCAFNRILVIGWMNRSLHTSMGML